MWRLVLALCLLASPSFAAQCQDVTWEGDRYSYCTVDPSTETLMLFLKDPDGRYYNQFSTLDDALQAQGQKLGFAMNAGMYHQDYAPVGHYVEYGAEVMWVVTNAGPGNFGMLPNGVFCISDSGARVVETRAFNDAHLACDFATQSGPMLVIDGALHPRFLPDGTSKLIRNGVGVTAEGLAVFAISNNGVNFHSFARFFRDALGTPNALYLDGKVSRLHAPSLGRSDRGFRMGPIVGTVVTD